VLKFLRDLFAGFGGLFENLFGFLGMIVQIVARTPMAMLELFGLVQPLPQQQAAEEAESAATQIQSQFGSVFDKRSVVWTPDHKLAQIARWCHWRTGVDTGLEPSLAGLSTREILKLKAADEQTLQALTLCTLPQIEQWVQSPKKSLTPLTLSQLETVKRHIEMQNRESEKARWNEVVDRLDARREAPGTQAAVDAIDSILRETEVVLKYQPARFSTA
jgi:hypothetical protein